jgi:DNA helicase-2/ATP-dependent DNA helicase PcrA
MEATFFERLNERQLEAVTTTEGPVLVIAGAGSGKTRVLTERIAYLVKHRGVSPRNILAFTFTNKAAREMGERLERSLPGITRELWVGTFHSTGVRILRRHGEMIGVPRNFSIYDTDDSLRLIKQVIEEMGYQGLILRTPRGVRDAISRWKNDMITPEEARARAVDNMDQRLAEVYRAYDAALRRAQALDFDDLIAKVVQLFQARPEVKRLYAERFRYVLVDEFQDTNPLQMVLIDDLSSHHRNLFVVGDDDQSIYSWRGARVEHILTFDGLYPDAKVIRLEQNYRSTRTILDAANAVIAHNRGRKGKTLWTDGERGEKIELLVSLDEEGEAWAIRRQVEAWVQEGFDPGEIAILYRTNAQSRALEEAFEMAGMPYQIVGAVRFYERAEVRDVLAYAKLLVNPADAVSFRRIVNVPRRGIGKATLAAVEQAASVEGVSPLEWLLRGGEGLPPTARRRFAEFVSLYRDLSALAERETAPEVLRAILRKTRYREYLKESYPDGEDRVENVEELVAGAERFAEEREDKSLAAYLEAVAMVSDVDNLENGQGVLKLMTLHNAKGLEFDCVVIAGLEEGLLPHHSALEEERELEEERRLFYVGMTRARRRLALSCAHSRHRFGGVSGQRPSRFLEEIPEECLEGSVETGWVRAPYEEARRRSPQPLEAGSVDATEPEDYSQEEVRFVVGMRVAHAQYGRGVVRRVEGSGAGMRVTVLFDHGEERTFVAGYAPMRPLG